MIHAFVFLFCFILASLTQYLLLYGKERTVLTFC